MELNDSDMRYKMRAGIYVPCKQCQAPHCSKHEFCVKCRRKECPECGESKTTTYFVGRICRKCMKKRGDE
jgi:hypothetical protein